MIIRTLQIPDIDEASRLIKRVSEKYSLKDFTEAGYQKFIATVLQEGMKQNMKSGFNYWGAFEESHMIGLIAVKPPAHLYNLFVHEGYHNRGVATRLWNHMLSELNPMSMTVYSSSFAVALYRKLGFIASGEKIENEDLICYPMQWNFKDHSFD